MHAYTGYLSGAEYLRRQREEARIARKERREHRSLGRFERLVRDLERVEGRIRKAHSPTNREHMNIRNLLRRRNRLVAMLEIENRRVTS